MYFLNLGKKCNSFANLFFLLLVVLVVQACSSGSSGVNTIVQAFEETDYKLSEIAWIYIGKSFEEDGSIAAGRIEFSFEIENTTFKTSRGGRIGVARHSRFFAFPAGILTYKVRFIYRGIGGGEYTQWMRKTIDLEGGKWYRLDSHQTEVDKWLIGKDYYHSFTLEEQGELEDMVFPFSVEWLKLYRIVGSPPYVWLDNSYKLTGDLFSSLKLRNNGQTIEIPAEFMRRLYRGFE